MSLVPEREREQAPELAREVLPSRDVRVDQTLDRLRTEEPLALERGRRERLAGEALEVAAQPGCGRDREPALAAVDDRARQQWLDRLPQHHLLRQAADLVPGRKREREPRHHRVEERHPRFERVRHRGAVGLREQVVDEVDGEVDVLQARQELGALRGGVRLLEER